MFKGNVWTSKPLTIKKDYFQYKYVIVESSTKKSVRWEEGINRIADLKLLKIESPQRMILGSD